MPLWQFQSNMNRGELDPLLVGRIDIQAYYNGLRKASNILTMSQGGAKRRPGQVFLGASLGNGRFEEFSFNTEQNYLLVFTDLKMQVYKDRVLQTNLNGSGNSFITTPWTLAQLQEFDFIQSADTAIVVQEDHAPRTIIRTSDTNWVISLAPLTNLPQFVYTPPTSPQSNIELQDVTLTSPNEGDRFKLSLENILTDEIIYSTNNDTMENNIKLALLDLPNTGNDGIDVNTTSSGLVYRVGFSASSSNDWDLMAITITFQKEAATEAEIVAVANGSSFAENVWSSGRGWPRTCTFHEGRLYFGGSKSRPATLWGSRVNDFFNFDVARSRDDASIDATLNTDQVNAIRAIYSNRTLQVFTSGAEFYVPQSPITPSNVSVQPQTNLGARRLRPVSMDGVTLFAQKTGKSLNQFVFTNDQKAIATASVSSLSPHLINNPIKLVASRGTESSDANYVYILNENGTLTVFNTLQVEGVQGFTTWECGIVKSISVVDQKLFLLVERVIDGATVYYVEVESENALTDSAIIKGNSGSATITALDHLEGELVVVKADGAYQGEFTVNSGAVTLARGADVVEVGLRYTPIIKTMPVNVGLQNGPNAASKKKILRVGIRSFESNGIIVNGQRLSDKTIGQNQFDAPEPQTDLKRVTLLGWSLEAEVTITQTTPFNMTILSIGLEVKD